ncbi:MAG: proline--tRNA ligase [Planctomycetota bacterium]|nr:MAG: proline--tRNA ligase [Planctomycetota bacterium]
MAKAPRTAITPTRAEDYPEWYQQVIRAADLAEPSPVRGCMVIKPWGYAVWEHMQRALDALFKDTGHVNAYFPLFIPLSYLEKEAEHVEGFAKECAVVTHHRLEAGPEGGLVPTGELEEPLVVRPTSETIIGAMYARWVKSYRDLPILINQWANVVRWELRTRMFLRTTEFLWQEGHTAHATREEAEEETLKMLDVYATFAQDYMAVPVIRGEKTAGERFPGAINTYSIEAMMQDRKALQAGTSHFLGQNFSRAQEIKYLSSQGKEEFAWTTSWGVSTRLVGALIMTHGDDDGLVLPPRLAPQHVVILPIYRNDAESGPVLEYCHRLRSELAEQVYEDGPVRALVDERDLPRADKKWQHVKRGVPVVVEVGPRDIEGDTLMPKRRDAPPGEKKPPVPRGEFVDLIESELTAMQENLFHRALEYREQNTRTITSLADFEEFFTPDNVEKPEIHGGFAVCHICEGSETAEILAKHKVTVRCIPLADQDGFGEPVSGKCIFTGQPTTMRAVLAKAY